MAERKHVLLINVASHCTRNQVRRPDIMSRLQRRLTISSITMVISEAMAMTVGGIRATETAVLVQCSMNIAVR